MAEPKLRGGDRIETGKWLIQQDEARAMEQRSGDCQLLAHAFGERAHAIVSAIEKAGRAQELLDPLSFVARRRCGGCARGTRGSGAR